MLEGLHHVAIIASNYERSLQFYTKVLGFELLSAVYRADRESWKADLGLHGKYLLELFSFPSPPPRTSQPEATGLRHLAFSVIDINKAIQKLQAAGVACEEIRIDLHTQKRFTFLADPDGLPIELYEL